VFHKLHTMVLEMSRDAMQPNPATTLAANPCKETAGYAGEGHSGACQQQSPGPAATCLALVVLTASMIVHPLTAVEHTMIQPTPALTTLIRA
jgi:hypothetical protein